MRDRLHRPLRDLRLSVTDRCNFRCTYCMPREAFGPDHAFLPRESLLSYEEMITLAGVFVEHGVTKIRLTGGEPLLRRDLDRLVAGLAGIEGLDDLAVTTNGSLLAAQAAGLAAAGLDRVTVSLDSVDPVVFARLTDSRVPLERVVEGIAAATAAGLGPVKLNAVIRRGLNDAGVLDLVHFARSGGHVLRFIEYMDVGATNAWQPDEVVPGRELLDRIEAAFPLAPVTGQPAAEVARRWRFRDGAGEIGLITSVSAPFCGSCTRARVTATGELFTCLFATSGTDLRAALRGGHDPAEAVRAVLERVWSARQDRYSEIRSEGAARGQSAAGRAEMSYLGG